jgi:hypothetical protein
MAPSFPAEMVLGVGSLSSHQIGSQRRVHATDTDRVRIGSGPLLTFQRQRSPDGVGEKINNAFATILRCQSNPEQTIMKEHVPSLAI